MKISVVVLKAVIAISLVMPTLSGAAFENSPSEFRMSPNGPNPGGAAPPPQGQEGHAFHNAPINVPILALPPGTRDIICPPPPNACPSPTAINDGTLHGSNLLNDASITNTNTNTNTITNTNTVNGVPITNTNTVNGVPIDNSDLLLP